MRFIRGHNSTGMNRSKPYKTHYVKEDHGYATPCWVWQLQTVKPNQRSAGGYGKTVVQGRTVLAHRWYYEQQRGPIPDGMQLDHLCRVPACVNPSHLEPVTPLENVRRGRGTKLTPEQAREIERRCKALTTRGTRSALAEEFGVSLETVRLIAKNGADGPRRGR